MSWPRSFIPDGWPVLVVEDNGRQREYVIGEPWPHRKATVQAVRCAGVHFQLEHTVKVRRDDTLRCEVAHASCFAFVPPPSPSRSFPV